jgi:hypothetical protein
LDFSISQPYGVALVGELKEAGTRTSVNAVYAACPPKEAVAGCAPERRRRTWGSYPFWRIGPHAMAGRPPTSVKATAARTLRPTRRGWCGSSAFRRDRKIGGRTSVLPGAFTPEDGVTWEGDLLGTDLELTSALRKRARKGKTRRKSAAHDRGSYWPHAGGCWSGGSAQESDGAGEADGAGGAGGAGPRPGSLPSGSAPGFSPPGDGELLPPLSGGFSLGGGDPPPP